MHRILIAFLSCASLSCTGYRSKQAGTNFVSPSSGILQTEPPASTVSSPPYSGGRATVKVMTLNILNGANGAYADSHIVHAIQVSTADIVGIQEAKGDSLARLASKLTGWSSFQIDIDTAILTRFKIIGPAGKHGAQIRLPQGGDLYIFSVHNVPYPYEPYDIRDGKLTSRSAVENSARTFRLPLTQNFLQDLKTYMASGAPVFLVGDFNEPSHRDWTPAAAQAGIHPFAVSWPTSMAIEAAGFVDTYRAAHPNEVQYPGYTWSTKPAAGEVFDRIDFVYADAESRVLGSATIGDAAAIPADIVSTPYWSDHGGVMSTLLIKSEAKGPSLPLNLFFEGS